MGNTISTFQTSFFFAALYLVPNNIYRYLTFSFMVASLAICAVNHASPTKRLARLEDTIKKTEDILERAMYDCARDLVDLLNARNRLRQYVHPSLYCSRHK
jgi:hypothetical protein